MGKKALKVKNLLSRVALETMNTKRLLAYRDRLYSVPENSGYHEQFGIAHKGNACWQETLENVLDILNTREHVPKHSK